MLPRLHRQGRVERSTAKTHTQTHQQTPFPNKDARWPHASRGASGGTLFFPWGIGVGVEGRVANHFPYLFAAS